MLDLDDGIPICEECGQEMESDDCPQCFGEGSFDLYDEDAINYAPGQEYETCQECQGTGVVWWCANKRCPTKGP